MEAPPSKSLTNRALILAALANGQSTLLDPLVADDTERMAEGLAQLGVEIRRSPDRWTIDGCGGVIPAREGALYAGDAGTTMRFLTGLVAAGHGTFLVDGSERMRQRPIGGLAEALQGMGVEVEFPGTPGYPPIRIRSTGLRGGRISLSGRVSSQFLSSILMVGPVAAEGLDLEVTGQLVSAPYVDMTIDLMEKFGVGVDREGYARFRIPPGQRYSARELKIEGDYSSASYFFAAAAITGGRVRITNLPETTCQGDRGFLEILQRMGCRVERDADSVTLRGAPLRGVTVDLRAMPDLAQTLAIVSLFAKGTTRLHGLASLRIKETDRLAALASEMGKLGAFVQVGRDHLEIEPRVPLAGAEIDTFNDHRMAMSFAVAGLRIPGIVILDPDCAAKSYPRFWTDLEAICR